MTKRMPVEKIGDSYVELIEFCRSLAVEGWSVDELLDVLEKPWKWQDEYTAWRKKGESNDEDSVGGSGEDCEV